jgi:hypothetical protein
MVEAVASLTSGPKVARAKDPQRSAIANGKLLPGVDQRSSWVRRCRELIADHLADLGGEDNASSAERSIIRRAAVLSVELELLESQFALAGQATVEQLDAYQRCASSLRRLFESIGIKRRPKDISPTLSEYLAASREDGD